MVIGVVTAMDCELRSVIDLMSEATHKKIMPYEYISGTVRSHQVICVCSGIGLVNAALATVALITNFKVDCIINPGVAGALTDHLHVCDVVISGDITYWDFNSKQLVTGFPHMKDILFKSDENLLEKCSKIQEDILAPNKFVQGRVVSGQSFVSDLSAKLTIYEKTKADCIEMEGAAIAHTCYLYSTPFIAIRSISDCLKDDGTQACISFQQFLLKACAQFKLVLDEFLVLL